MAQSTPSDKPLGQQMSVSSPATNTCLVDKPWLLALILVILTFVAYQPTWHAGFIWDDDDHLTANPAMTAPHGLQMIWSSLAISRYYPLTLTNFWVQHRFWGLNPLPYHLVNIALHAINGILVFLVLRRLRIPAAWLAATMWVLHPVNVESVAWITELKNTQSGFFFFAALLCFLQFEAKGQNRWYALALLCGAGAFLSKPSTVVLPLVLLLCVWWERGSWRRKDLVRTLPFFAMALFMSALTVVEQRNNIARQGTAEWSPGVAERIVVAGKAVCFYAGKVFWPVNLTFVYPRWEVTANSIWSWLPLAGVVACIIVLWVWRQRSWARAGLFGVGFFVTALLPVLGFFDVFYFRYSFVADHFQYLASLGLIACATSGIAQFLGRNRLSSAWVVNVIYAALLLTLTGLTWEQTHIYRNPETIWEWSWFHWTGCQRPSSTSGRPCASIPTLSIRATIWVSPWSKQANRKRPLDSTSRPCESGQIISKRTSIWEWPWCDRARFARRSNSTSKHCESSRIIQKLKTIWPGCWRRAMTLSTRFAPWPWRSGLASSPTIEWPRMWTHWPPRMPPPVDSMTRLPLPRRPSSWLVPLHSHN
jgi:hypothetical protein